MNEAIENEIRPVEQTESPCEWEYCNAPASKHVLAGLRIFGFVEIPDDQKIDYTVRHLDLCRSHVAQAWINYFDVTIYGLNECPEHCKGLSYP